MSGQMTAAQLNELFFSLTAGSGSVVGDFASSFIPDMLTAPKHPFSISALFEDVVLLQRERQKLINLLARLPMEAQEDLLNVLVQIKEKKEVLGEYKGPWESALFCG